MTDAAPFKLYDTPGAHRPLRLSPDHAKSLGAIEHDPNAAPPASIHESKTVVELKAEIDARNGGRADDALLSTEGKKADLVAILDADDTAVPSVEV